VPYQPVDKRTFLKTAAAATLLGGRAAAGPPPPNIVFINTDDLGSADLGCYGSGLSTPYLDWMARDGVRFTQMNAASPVCSPSRASLMTGRYPTRVGMPGVLWPDSPGGLPDSETTIAQVLKTAGYRTACVGKWHLGSQPAYLPTSKGFDEYYGIPYSHDMWPPSIYRNADVAEKVASPETLTAKYTREAVDFIRRAKGSPFFLYLAHNQPHLPTAASSQFRCVSGLGVYGDAVQEIDWSVGRILTALGEAGLDDQTLVMFSSDHGPWFSGSAGRLRGRKAQTFEGGVRVPFLARFPGQIPRGLVAGGLASNMDILPTVARLAGAPLPPKPLDGVDIWPMMTGEKAEVERDVLLYFDSLNLQCARLGRWKLHVARSNTTPWTPVPAAGIWNLPLPRPELYDLAQDPGESYDVSVDNGQIVADIRARMESLLAGFPAEVMTEWRATAARKVDDVPSGGWPCQSGG
jgi:arylsulfatase A-like enzyme